MDICGCCAQSEELACGQAGCSLNYTAILRDQVPTEDLNASSFFPVSGVWEIFISDRQGQWLSNVA